jgi:hypothetical protein
MYRRVSYALYISLLISKLSLDFQGPPLPMAFLMDSPPSRGEGEEYFGPAYIPTLKCIEISFHVQ